MAYGDSLPSHLLPPPSKTEESTSQRINNPGTVSSPRSPDVTNHCNDIDGILMYHCAIDYNEITCAAIKRDNTQFAYGLCNSSIHVQDLDLESYASSLRSENGEPASKRRYTDDTPVNHDYIYNYKCLYGHSRQITGMAYGPYGILMSCSQDSTVRGCRMGDYAIVMIYSDHKKSVLHITTSRNDINFATGGKDCTARLWNYKRKTAERTYNHSAIVDCVAFDRSSKYLATASGNKRVQIFTIQNGLISWTLPSHDAYVNCIEFSPDGRQIACADDNGCIKIWDLVAQQLYSETKAHSNPNFDISYNTDGSMFASCDSNGCIKLWDARKTLQNGSHDNLGEYHPDEFEPFYISFREKDKLISVGKTKLA